MLDMRLYMAQRLTAMVMAPLVITHIAVMIYAIQGGLSAEEILSRTQGSLWWFLFYELFVVAVAIHAAIGLRVILSETTGLKGQPLGLLTLAFGLLSLVMGTRAVLAVTLS